MVLLISVSFLLGCGDDGPAGGERALTGRTFLSQSILDQGEPFALVEGTHIRISFEEKSLGVSGGCNTGGGDYTVENGRLVAEVVEMTAMACDDARMAQDDWIIAFLSQRPAIELDGDRLSLTTNMVRIDMLDRRVADPDRPLPETVWQATTLIEGQSATSTPEVGDVHLVFDSDGMVSVDTGCNTGSAAYAPGPDAITFDDLVLTEIACGETRSRIEEHLVGVLEGEVGFAIDGASLTLMRGNIGLGLTAADG